MQLGVGEKRVPNLLAPLVASFTFREDATKRGASHEDGSAWHADRVLEYLETREATGTEKPFFIYFGFSHPHDPRWANDELLAIRNAGYRRFYLNPGRIARIVRQTPHRSQLAYKGWVAAQRAFYGRPRTTEESGARPVPIAAAPLA